MRAKRRHHYKRLKDKRKHYWGGCNDCRRLGMLVDTPKPYSSCMCCSNPRKFQGPTRQEKRGEYYE